MSSKTKAPTHNFDIPGYEKLAEVLRRAYEQSAIGKGAVRHANDKPFHLQPIAVGVQHFGVGGALFQAFKKMEEAQRMPVDAAVSELLGAIVYLSAAVNELEREG